MLSSIKRFLPWFLVAVGVGTAASVIRLNQIRGFALPGPTFLIADSNGIITQGKLVGATVDAAGLISLPIQTAVLPSLTVTKITTAGQNAFPIPGGRTLCFVSLNIPQAVGEDYTISTGNIISFNQAPQVGDVVQLLCF